MKLLHFFQVSTHYLLKTSYSTKLHSREACNKQLRLNDKSISQLESKTPRDELYSLLLHALMQMQNPSHTMYELSTSIY